MPDHAIRMYETGGPEVFKWEPVETPEPGPGEALIRQTAVGVNFIDVYVRTGLYPLDLPAIPGVEGAGVVEALGPGAEGVAIGDRVAYGAAARDGAYAARRVLAADRLVNIPEGLSDEEAAAVMLKGLTAWMLLLRVHDAKAGDVILLHAAAGGVGTILSQWARGLGATVIGVVSTKEKAETARRNGCAHVILTPTDISARVRELTGGRGVDVAYDSVGAATWDATLDSMAPRGLVVSFGNASGPVPPFPPLLLSQKGSLFLTRPTLFHYVADAAELRAGAAALFAEIESGRVAVKIGQRFALSEASKAHRALEGRATTGSTVLIP